MIKVIGFIFSIVVFIGCSMKEVSQPIVKYTIDDNTRVEKVQQQSDKILKIVRFKSPKYMHNSNIWYERSSYETNSYLYSEWNEDFISLIERSIANSIFDSSLFKSSFIKYSKSKPDLLLEGEIIEAIQKIDKNSSALVSFKIRLYLIKPDDSKLVGLKEFSYTKDCKSIDAKGAIMAHNEIIKNLNKDVIAWLKILVTKN